MDLLQTQPVTLPLRSIALCLLSFGLLTACTDGTEGGTTGTGAADLTGIWERRTADATGDETDIAIGVVRGEPANRVWACEVRPNVPAVLLQRGTLTGNRVRWDAVHGVPDYTFARSGDQLTVQVDFPGARPTNYTRGTWNRFCPELEDSRIFVLFTMTGGTARLTSASSSLPCAPSPVIGQRYGGCPAGSFTYSVTASNGLSNTNVAARLEKPSEAMRRIYSVGYHYNPILNRYLVGWPYEDVSNVGGRIVIQAGDAQTAERGSRVPVAPAARVTTPQGEPVVGATVHFRVLAGEGSIEAIDGTPVSRVSVPTDSNGIASPGPWTLGPTPGENRLTASALDMDGSPVTFTATGTEDFLVNVSAGSGITCARSEASRLLCWGSGLGAGPFHRPDYFYKYRPSEAAAHIRLDSLDAGDMHACGLDAQGQAICWGANFNGNLGRASTVSAGFPDTVHTGSRFTSITAGGEHSCALTSAGTAFCWGDNHYGQLGDGSTTTRLTPVAVAGGRSFVQISAGRAHTCAITAAGAAYCWGLNAGHLSYDGSSNGGALGDGTRSNRSQPTLVSGGHNFVNISAGSYATCGIVSGGLVRCWGDNAFNWLATASTAPSVLTPTQVNGSTTFARVVAGGNHACALTQSGALFCCGNTFRVGLATTPAEISGNFSRISAGRNHNCAVSTADKQVYCWGSNSHRQLGLDVSGPLTVPTQITSEREPPPNFDFIRQ